MAERVKLKTKPKTLRDKLDQNILKPTGIKKKHMKFISTGSWLFNLALTNNIDCGYPIGRVINPIGDYSTGKTLLACEAVNVVWYYEHILKKKKIKIYYDEPEYAFDLDLATKFKMPLEHIHGLKERLPTYKKKDDEEPFQHSRTVEDLHKTIERVTTKYKSQDIILYVLDSLDSLTDAREIKHIEKKGVEKKDMGGSKAAALSQLFRNTIVKINNSNVVFLIVSQVRMNVGVIFGPKIGRSGGKALDHYASQIFFLNEKDQIKSEHGINQGIEAGIHITKNKTGSRYNDVNIDIIHGYGIDNYGSTINYLWDNDVLEKSGAYVELPDTTKMYRKELIELMATNGQIQAYYKNMLQEYWDKIIEESEIKRVPKYS